MNHPLLIGNKMSVQRAQSMKQGTYRSLGNKAFGELKGADMEAQKAWGHHFNERGMMALESFLKMLEGEGSAGRFTVGDAFSAADLFLIPQVQSARRFGVTLDPFVRVLAAEAAALAAPFAQEAQPVESY